MPPPWDDVVLPETSTAFRVRSAEDRMPPPAVVALPPVSFRPLIAVGPSVMLKTREFVPAAAVFWMVRAAAPGPVIVARRAMLSCPDGKAMVPVRPGWNKTASD